MIGLTALRIELSHHGYPPVPVTSPWAKGVDSPGKAPRLRAWQIVCRTADEAEIASWPRRLVDHGNTGILCGDIVAIDIDVMDDELANKIEVHARTRLGDTPLRRVGLPPKRLLVYRTDRPFPKLATGAFVKDGKKCLVEALAEGEQFVAFGGHPSGHDYTWTGDTPLQMAASDIPTVTAGQCGAFLDECATIMRFAKATLGEAGGGGGRQGAIGARPLSAPPLQAWCGIVGNRPPRELVAEALRFIPCGELDYLQWITIGHSLAAALGDDGGELWISWSDGYAQNDRATSARKWAGFSASRSSHRTLFSWAERRGWKGWPSADREGAMNDARAQPDAKDAPPDTDLGVWDAGDDDYVIPPREWLLGTAFCRTFVSTLIADGAIGKTTLRIAQHLALATGRPFTGEHVFLRCRTLMLCFEDDRNELRRRVRAAMIHHGVTADELKGHLFLAAIRQCDLKLALLDNYGNAIAGPLGPALMNAVTARGIDLVTLDPFVKTHAVEENSNPHIDFVTGILADMATALNVATDLTHHTSKGPSDAGNADRGRGASAHKNAGRILKTLAVMTPEEAEGFGVSDLDRRSLVRMDNGKVNLTRPAREAQWFRLVSVSLGNGNEIYPNGDEVQAIEVWTPPGQFDGIGHHVINLILDRIDAGTAGGERYTDANRATDRAVWHVFGDLAPDLTERQARNIVNSWKKTGLLYHTEYESKSQRKMRSGLSVNNGKRPS
jgi:hypothetical protein